MSQCVRRLPITIIGFAVLSGLLVVTETQFTMVFSSERPGVIGHLTGMIFHRGMEDYRGNMLLFVPFGMTLTLLTSNRHVLGLIVLTHFPASIVYAAFGGGIVGSSIVAMGIAGVTLVRAIGEGMEEWLQTILLGILTPFLLVLLIVAVVNVPPGVAHLGHFLGFLFGAGYESILVLTEHTHASVIQPN